jgi:hypothetical protein
LPSLFPGLWTNQGKQPDDSSTPEPETEEGTQGEDSAMWSFLTGFGMIEDDGIVAGI